MTIMTYLLQLTLCWGLFALLYAVFLRRETFFHANRAYLLGTVLLGIVLPLAGRLFPAFSAATTGIPFELPALAVEWRQAEQTLPPAWWSGVFRWVYAAGAALALLRLLWGLSKLLAIARSGRKQRLPDGMLLIHTDEARMPFSFFHWIFVPDAPDGQEDFHSVLLHERAHVRGWHSADVLLLELLCVVFWFHPLVHWYRKTLRTIHEYSADAAASRHTSRKQYGQLLVRQWQFGQTIAFANHFFQSPLRQRLLMLTRRASPAIRSWKYALALPLALALWAFTQGQASEASGDTPLAHAQLEKMPAFPGGTAALTAYLGAHIRYPDAARKARAEGLVLLQFVVDKGGAVTQVEPLQTGIKPVRQDLVDEAIRVVRHMPAWTPGYKQGRPVSSVFRLPVQFKLE